MKVEAKKAGREAGDAGVRVRRLPEQGSVVVITGAGLGISSGIPALQAPRA